MDLTNLLFLDIETVSEHKTLEEYPERLQESHAKKERDFEMAALNPVYSKIVAVSFGKLMRIAEKMYSLSYVTLSSHNEHELLMKVKRTLDSNRDMTLCAHNGKGFDFPFIAKRLIKHGIDLPPQLNILGKKPWEMQLEDTKDWFAMGAFGKESHVSMVELTAFLNIPTPKDDIDGSEVGRVYWEENNLKRIETYVGKDVVALANVALVLTGNWQLLEDNIKGERL